MTMWRCIGLKKFAKAGYAATAVILAFPQVALAEPAVLATNGHPFLGSGLVDHSQKMTMAARATAEKKAMGHRS